MEVNERNIRLYKGNYVVRIMRRKKTLTDARKLIKYIEQFTNCVGVYEDRSTKQFVVQTYKEFSKIDDAIKLRDILECELLKLKQVGLC